MARVQCCDQAIAGVKPRMQLCASSPAPLAPRPCWHHQQRALPSTRSVPPASWWTRSAPQHRRWPGSSTAALGGGGADESASDSAAGDDPRVLREQARLLSNLFYSADAPVGEEAGK